MRLLEAENRNSNHHRTLSPAAALAGRPHWLRLRKQLNPGDDRSLPPSYDSRAHGGVVRLRLHRQRAARCAVCRRSGELHRDDAHNGRRTVVRLLWPACERRRGECRLSHARRTNRHYCGRPARRHRHAALAIELQPVCALATSEGVCRRLPPAHSPPYCARFRSLQCFPPDFFPLPQHYAGTLFCRRLARWGSWTAPSSRSAPCGVRSSSPVQRRSGRRPILPSPPSPQARHPRPGSSPAGCRTAILGVGSLPRQDPPRLTALPTHWPKHLTRRQLRSAHPYPYPAQPRARRPG